MEYELIHVNLGLAKYPLQSQEMQSFWALEQPIYDISKQYAGFSREITFPDRFSVFPEPHIFNATAWKSIDDLKDFVYTGMHAQALKDRKQWFTNTPPLNTHYFGLKQVVSLPKNSQPKNSLPTASTVRHPKRLTSKALWT